MTNRVAGKEISKAALAPLAEGHGGRWKVWASAEGRYACATLCRGLSWVRPYGGHPVGVGGTYVLTLVEESPEELATAIEHEDEHIACLLANGVLEVTRP